MPFNDATSFRVKAATQQHIREVAKDLGYAPNRLASGLRNQRSQILGLVSDEITTTPFAGAMIRGAQDAAYERGYVVMVVNSGFDSELESREISMLQQHQVDGVLYARMYHQSAQIPTQLAGLPIVLLDAVTTDTSISSVVPDEVGAGETAVEALIHAGHTRIGMINNRDDIPATHGRREGFLNALRRHGLEHDPSTYAIGTAHTKGAVRRLLNFSAGKIVLQLCSASTTGLPWALTRRLRLWGFAYRRTFPLLGSTTSISLRTHCGQGSRQSPFPTTKWADGRSTGSWMKLRALITPRSRCNWTVPLLSGVPRPAARLAVSR
ncbi:substrate-binding domain-containing protein [Arthrobacter sp. SA17]